ncbi:hypothetical protein EB061_07470 [bacterium]|nr:hypothetical protein [bacterium]
MMAEASDLELVAFSEMADLSESLAIELDAWLSRKEIPTHVVVNALSSVLTHALAQMYSVAYNDGALRSSIADLAETGISKMVADIKSHIDAKGLSGPRTLN